ncbi:DUF721 domain-containing protein [Salinisphaera aquimarina]|uniref:DUF721 domain-containing protein n=1 Tax=Salinisphaera aquimarina TaxID=2094031 RepID=A0ABV7EIA6_9GAMM
MLHTATPDIADLLGRARFLERIRAALLEILPAAAGPLVRVAAYDQYRLTLHVGHASWATRLRYMQPAIAQALAQRMKLHIESVQIRVRIAPSDTTPPVKPRYISPDNRTHIRQIASYVSDPQLADALQRLALTGATDST